MVHNGILENYQELRSALQADGVEFKSQTDTETMAHLVSKHYQGDLRNAVCSAVKELHGAFAFGIICADSPDEMIAVRRFSPLVIGIGEEENYIASDMGAIRPETDKVYVIDDDETPPEISNISVTMTNGSAPAPTAGDARRMGASRVLFPSSAHAPIDKRAQVAYPWPPV